MCIYMYVSWSVLFQHFLSQWMSVWLRDREKQCRNVCKCPPALLLIAGVCVRLLIRVSRSLSLCMSRRLSLPLFLWMAVSVSSNIITYCTRIYVCNFIHSFLLVLFDCIVVADVLLYVQRNPRIIRDGSPGQPPQSTFTQLLAELCWLYQSSAT